MTYPNLDHLKYFCDAAELGSISAAAQRNHVTHPAVSRAIVALESQLGVELLVHQKRSFQLTSEGLRLLEQARTLLAAAKKFQSSNLRDESDLQGEISIGLSRTLAKAYLYPLLRTLHSQFPKMRANVRFGTTAEIVENVSRGTIDLGLTIGTQGLPTLKQEKFASGSFTLVEADQARTRKERWEEKSFLLTEARFETELLKREYYKKFRTPLQNHLEIRSWESIAQLARDGFGVGLVPELILQKEPSKGLRILNASWYECDYTVFSHVMKQRGSNRALKAALEFLSESYSKKTMPS